MAFIIDKETVAPGVILFRRGDVDHRNWYCRVKLPKADRYKTFSLKTEKITEARELANDHASETRWKLKNDVPVFDRPFLAVAREFVAVQQERAARGEITEERVHKLRSITEHVLNDYVGSTQITKIGPETWEGYPGWRRANGWGRNTRNGVRAISEDLAKQLVEKEAASRERARAARGLRPIKEVAGEHKPPTIDIAEPVPVVSDTTIRHEMGIFAMVMNYAIKKRYAAASQRFDQRPKLKIMRRDAFTLEEYRRLHTKARSWVKEDAAGRGGQPVARSFYSTWYRTVVYNFILIMCNTGMRPSEARNLRWGDVTPAKDKDGREIVVLFVQGKGKSRKLVAPQSVLDYLNRIRAIARSKPKDAKSGEGKIIVGNPSPTDFVFTTITGGRCEGLYQALIEDVLTAAGLREGENGLLRSTYCFRHTYATLRLQEGVDVYFLAEQMGTSVKMIEDHYGHVNTIRHADRVLQGMGGWESPVGDPDEDESTLEAAHEAGARARTRPKSKLSDH